jgi:ribosome-associated protein
MPITDYLSLARLAAEAAADKKADNILLLDLREQSMVADYFVICSGNTDRQLRAIANAIDDAITQEYQTAPHHIEGVTSGGWVLMDYGDLIVHILAPSRRAYYNLEGLWANAPVLLKMI